MTKNEYHKQLRIQTADTNLNIQPFLFSGGQTWKSCLAFRSRGSWTRYSSRCSAKRKGKTTSASSSTSSRARSASCSPTSTTTSTRWASQRTTGRRSTDSPSRRSIAAPRPAASSVSCYARSASTPRRKRCRTRG